MSEKSLPPFMLVYFVVWTMLAIGTAILYHVRRDAEFRIRWHAKIGLIVSILIGVFMLLAAPYWIVFLFILVFGGVITYLNISKTTICTKCGRIIQGVGLVRRAKFCPHCGGETVRSKIFGT